MFGKNDINNTFM